MQVDPAHSRLGREGDELRLLGAELVLADAVLLGQHDDRTPLRRLVGQRRHLCGLGQLGFSDARHREERCCLAVADRDRPGLVEQQHVDVARGLDRPPRERQDVAAHEPVHTGDADRRKERSDRRGDECYQQRDQGRNRDLGVGEQREGPQRHDHEHEDQG